jgi:DNA polymerase III psi subunit
VSEGHDIQVRNQYLKTLGIVQYRPRDLTAETIQAQPLTNVDTGATVSEPSAAQAAEIASVIEAVTEEPIKPVVAKAKSINVEPKVAHDLALKFALWQPSDQLLVVSAVVDQLPDPSQISLLKNILRAIDLGIASLPQFDVVNWPPHPSMSGDESDAREFLSTLIKSKLASKPTKTVLFLGVSAQDWFLSDEQKDKVVDGCVELSESVTALSIPTLETLLNKPETKRQAWHTICGYLSSQTDSN